MLKNIIKYLNPISRLGNTNYSATFSFIFTSYTALLLEIYAYKILKNPEEIGILAIFIFIAMIIYLAFRDGIIGGITAVGVTIAYYFYIIYSRNYQGERLFTGVETTLILGVLYLLLACVIGWLKQTIDRLIEHESEGRRRLQAIVEQLPVGVVITDKNGVITLANKQADSILNIKVPIGFQSGYGNFVNVSKNGKKINNSESLLATVINKGNRITDREYVIEKKEGKRIHILVNTSAIQNKEGKVIAAASIFNDVTQQKENEQRKDDFINMASHELKTPITSLKLYINLLKKISGKYKNPAVVKIINNINSQSEKLHKLVNDLLDVSRLQTGKLNFIDEKFRLDLLIDEVVNSIQPSIRQKIILFSSRKILVNGDRFRIYQVLSNLLTNASKYSPESDKIIMKTKVDNKFITISVRDFGIGIAKEQQKKIFEKMYQVADDTEKTFPGLGMGLYISKEIVKKHGGSIWVESEKGKGSTFHFTLPKKHEKD